MRQLTDDKAIACQLTVGFISLLSRQVVSVGAPVR